MPIDARAAVDPRAQLGEGCRIGPFCVVGPDVTLGERVTLHAHVVVAGRTTVGAGTEIYPFAAIGHRAQDLKYAGEASTVCVGAGCTIRESVTIHAGTAGGGLATTIGDRCALLAGAHVAHDCRLGDEVVLSNNVMLAGHVQVGNGAILGGGVGVHQFVRVGEGAFVGGLSGLEGDLIPFGLAIGNRAHLAGLNLVGLRRRGVQRDAIGFLSQAVELLFRETGTLVSRIAEIEARFGRHSLVSAVLDFLKMRSPRGSHRRALCRPATATGRMVDQP